MIVLTSYNFEFMEKREDRMVSDINQLIDCVRKDTNTDESIREQIQSYARRVFSSGPGRPANDSEEKLKEKVATRVKELGGDQRTIVGSQDMTERFLNNTSVYRKQEVLRMLLKLS